MCGHKIVPSPSSQVHPFFFTCFTRYSSLFTVDMLDFVPHLLTFSFFLLFLFFFFFFYFYIYSFFSCLSDIFFFALLCVPLICLFSLFIAQLLSPVVVQFFALVCSCSLARLLSFSYSHAPSLTRSFARSLYLLLYFCSHSYCCTNSSYEHAR